MTAIIEPIIVEINHNSRKLYRLHNKDIIAEKAKKYNFANKESIAIKKRKYKDSIASREKEIVVCKCGSSCSRQSLLSHSKTAKHKNNMETKNTDVIVEKIVEIIEIANKMEVIIPPRKIYDGYSLLYLENERLGLSQSPPPIIWKKRFTCIIKRGSNEPKRRIVRQRINGVLTGVWGYVKSSSCSYV
jgi:hypothetical protein